MAVLATEVLKHVHASRLAPYRAVAGGDDEAALALYEWNIELAGALQGPLGIAEVAVRHAIDTRLGEWSDQHTGSREWVNHVAAIPYLSERGVFSTTHRKLYKAADESRRARSVSHPRRGNAITHDDLVAHVMFGTWARLLPEKYDSRWVDRNGNPGPGPGEPASWPRSMAALSNRRLSQCHTGPAWVRHGKQGPRPAPVT